MNVLRDYPHAEALHGLVPLLKAADLLLQERVPRTSASVFAEDLELETARTHSSEGESVMRVFTNPTLAGPEGSPLVEW